MVISLYSCGRDEANFPRADEFLPERWLRGEKGEFQGVINPNATLPFAMGARSCIGRKLAEVQMSLTMAEVSDIIYAMTFLFLYIVDNLYADFKLFAAAAEELQDRLYEQK